MKRKTLIVLLVLLLVGILAFTVFACNDNKKPNNPNTGTTPGGEGPGDDDDPPEDETYAIVEALPKLVTGLDKVAATVGDINEGKAAYLGADIGLNFGVTAEGLEVAADLDLSLKVSVDEGKAANNWALIGLNSDGKEVAQLFIHAEAANKEVIYIKEALTGNDNWKRLSVLDTSDSDLTGLFTTPGGADLDSAYNDEDVEGFDKETGYHHVYSGGLIGRLFGLIDVMTNGPFAKPITDKDGTITGYEPEGGKPVIDFGSASPIGGLEIMEGSNINSIVGLVGVLGEVVDGALHAEAYDNGNRYVATLNRAGIGSLVEGLLGMFAGGNEGDAEGDAEGGLFDTLEALNPVLRLVLGMEVKDGKFNVLKYDDPADAPVLDIEFSVDPDTAALTDLSINFSNGDIEGMGIKLGLALSNIVLSDESKAPETETAGAEDLGINLDLEAKLPAWGETGAAIAVSINPNAVIGFDSDGYVQVDLSGIAGHATFNGDLIAEYTDHNDQKGFAIDLGPVYDFIAPLETGVSATDLRDKVYFINCDLTKIVTAALNKEEKAGNNTETIQNAALTDQAPIDLSGTLGTLIETIQALSKPGADILGGIGNIIGPALEDSNSIVKLLLAEITDKNGAITFDPELGADITTGASVTVNASALVDFVMGENLLGGAGFDQLLNIQLYDFSAAKAAVSEDDIVAANEKKDLTLDGIFDGDIIEVVVDLIYSVMYDKADPNTRGTFVEFVKDKHVDEQFIKNVAAEWGITAMKDGLTVAEIGDITASINLGNGIHVTLEALGAYVSLGADLNKYVAPSTSIDTTGVEAMGSYNEKGELSVAFKGSDLEKALLELADYALGTTNFEFPAE